MLVCSTFCWLGVGAGRLSCQTEESLDRDCTTLVQSAFQDSTPVCAREAERSGKTPTALMYRVLYDWVRHSSHVPGAVGHVSYQQLVIPTGTR